MRPLLLTAVLLLLAPLVGGQAQVKNDPLPSWNEGPAKKRILDFVRAATDKTGKDYVKPSERITVFDNDGTLWCEQPVYVQVIFAMDRVKALVDKNPGWKEKEPFKSALADDLKGVLASGEKGLFELIVATHTGMTTEEFENIVKEWLAKARHPRFKRPYTDCVYKPMVELLAYLRGNSFKTYIVSGGSIEFMRPWTEKAYGIPPEQVIGSCIKTKYELRDGKPVLMRLPEVDFIDDKAGKPVGIERFIGRHPVAVFGNSDGDYEMMRYVTAASGMRMGMIVHHDDDKREYAYDRKSHVGRLARGLDEAKERDWTVISMKNDWKTIFAFEK